MRSSTIVLLASISLAHAVPYYDFKHTTRHPREKSTTTYRSVKTTTAPVPTTSSCITSDGASITTSVPTSIPNTSSSISTEVSTTVSSTDDPTTSIAEPTTTTTDEATTTTQEATTTTTEEVTTSTTTTEEPTTTTIEEVTTSTTTTEEPTTTTTEEVTTSTTTTEEPTTTTTEEVTTSTTTTEEPTTTTTTTTEQESTTTTTTTEEPTTTTAATTTTTTEAATTTSSIVLPTTYIGKVLFHHNAHRTNHSAADLTWNSTLAGYAAQLAARCVFSYDSSIGGGGYGQSIDTGFPPTQIGRTITDSMYNNEVENYPGPYGQNNVDLSNFPGWGRFSQLVWASTTSVGCATQFCPNGVVNAGAGTQYITVCDYSPAGNFVGEFSNVKAPIGLPVLNGDITDT